MSCFESSNIFLDWNKFIPFSSAVSFLSSLQWPETTSGMVQKITRPSPTYAYPGTMSRTDGHLQ